MLLPRIPMRSDSRRIASGPMCGHIGIPGHEVQRKNRLPLHRQYRFDKPGVYEARYTRLNGLPGPPDSQPIFRTAWTRIEILPAQPGAPVAPPQDIGELLSDYLPGILGFPDDAHLRLFTEYLYHADDRVREYTSRGLAFWSDDEINRRLTDLLHTRGPSNFVAEWTFRTPGTVDFILPHCGRTTPC